MAYDAAAASYDPSSRFRFNSLGGTFAASRSAAGTYAMEFGLHKGSNKTMPIVTAYGTAPTELGVHCHPDSWGSTRSRRPDCRVVLQRGRRAHRLALHRGLPDRRPAADHQRHRQSNHRPHTSTGAIAFTIGDDITPAASLTVAGISSNTTLVPNANIVFGGAGAAAR